MIKYLITKCIDGSDAFTKVNEDGTTYSFSQTSSQTDYKTYLKWLDAGNTPEATDAAPAQEG